VDYRYSKAVRAALGAALTVAIALSAPIAEAQTKSQKGRDKGQYIPTIWTDPDGCEHWVMDDGVEGYMTPHVSRKGIPVCNRQQACAVMNSDQFFATDSARIHPAGKTKLTKFFQEANAQSYIIIGHTDSRASDAYNLQLSFNRASSVAKIAVAAGAKIANVKGLGERLPVAPNNTSSGQAKNRRVEIVCLR